jgi:hypothetical protein
MSFFKEYLKSVYVCLSEIKKWYDLIRVSDLDQYGRLHMISGNMIYSVPGKESILLPLAYGNDHVYTFTA